MSGHSKSVLFLLERCVAARQLALPAARAGRFFQQRTWTSAARAMCLQRLCQVRPTLKSSQYSFSTEPEEPYEDEYPPLPAYQSDSEPQKDVFLVQVRGLPWSCTADHLLRFFSECRICNGVKGIHLTLDRLRRPSGKAFIEMEGKVDVNKALEKDRQYLGPRYVEVSEVTNSAAELILKKAVSVPPNDGVVRLKGLPYSSTEPDIVQFFSGFNIVTNGITIVTDFDGRSTGEAFVQFSSQQEADEALQRDREVIGKRYIRVFPSTSREIYSLKDPQAPPSAPQAPPSASQAPPVQPVITETNQGTRWAQSSQTHYIHMGGHPFNTSGEDVVEPEEPYEDEYPPLPAYQSDSEPRKDVYLVKVRGLPWSCTADHLLRFFSECRICNGVKGIHLTLDRLSRPSGEAFIEMEGKVDVNKALEKDRQYLGPRYVEVSEVTNSAAELIVKKDVSVPPNDGVVRLKGLPYSSTEPDIVQFFSGLNIVTNGITFVTDFDGRSTGVAFVQFSSQQEADEALQRDREVIGKRYIRVFPSTSREIYSWKDHQAPPSAPQAPPSAPQAPPSAPQAPPSASQAPSGWVQSSQTHYIHMRGIPFSSSGEDIVKFFSPLVVSKIMLECGPNGMLTGEGAVYFQCHQDAIAAMSKDRQYLGGRYVELFLNSRED